MNFQDWLILIGAIILIVIILDGVRRMRQAKRDSLQMSRDMGGTIDGGPLDEEYNPELPCGGARIIGKDDSSDEHADSFADGLTACDALGDLSADVSSRSDSPEVRADLDDSLVHAGEPSVTRSFPQKKPAQTEAETDTMVASTLERAVDAPGRSLRFDKKTDSLKDKPAVQAADNVTKIARMPSEVLVINVDARTVKGFAGTELKRLLEACGLVHGEMSIFHRHEEDDLLSPLQFSVANGVEPGYFDTNSIESISTPRVAFFMSLPGPRDSMRAFDFMLETAQCFARNLDGELRDENRSAITQQTIEHCRQRIREFERKQLSRNRKA